MQVNVVKTNKNKITNNKLKRYPTNYKYIRVYGINYRYVHDGLQWEKPLKPLHYNLIFFVHSSAYNIQQYCDNI